MDILKRLDRLQAKRCQEETRIIKLIDAGAFYDDLSEEDKDAYCEYRHFTRGTIERVELAVRNTLHFPLERIPAPEPLEKVQAEIYAMLME